MKQLYRVEWSGCCFVMAESASEASTLAELEMHDPVGVGIDQAASLATECRDPSWRDAIPYGADDERTVRQILDSSPAPGLGRIILAPNGSPTTESAASTASDCQHGVTFDEAAARGLSSHEIRQRWPRLMGPCPLGCGWHGIYYASWAHYIGGDW